MDIVEIHEVVGVLAKNILNSEMASIVTVTNSTYVYTTKCSQKNGQLHQPTMDVYSNFVLTAVFLARQDGAI